LASLPPDSARLAGRLDEQRHRAELVERKEAGVARAPLHRQRRFQLQLVSQVLAAPRGRRRLQSQEVGDVGLCHRSRTEPNGGMVGQRAGQDDVGHAADARVKLLAQRQVQLTEDEVVGLRDADLVARLPEVAGRAVGQGRRSQVVEDRRRPAQGRCLGVEQLG